MTVDNTPLTEDELSKLQRLDGPAPYQHDSETLGIAIRAAREIRALRNRSSHDEVAEIKRMIYVDPNDQRSALDGVRSTVEISQEILSATAEQRDAAARERDEALRQVEDLRSVHALVLFDLRTDLDAIIAKIDGADRAADEAMALMLKGAPRSVAPANALAQAREFAQSALDRLRAAERNEREPSNLERHAETEMRRAGLYDADSDYGGQVPGVVLGMVRAMVGRGLSGGSHALVMEVFGKVANYKNLTPLTDDPSEWEEIAAEMRPSSVASLHQNRRCSSCFSQDGGKTYYDVDGMIATKVGTVNVVTGERHPVPDDATKRDLFGAVADALAPLADTEHDREVLADLRAVCVSASNRGDHMATAYNANLEVIAYLAAEIVAKGASLDDLSNPIVDRWWASCAVASQLRAAWKAGGS